ncbi:MAG: OB-fold domain-containing protein [Thermoplasmata archaeon]|nr:OB-fold domain-containing protein [Thermoplasmata archaeon]
MESKRTGHSIEEYRRGHAEEDRLRGFRSGCGFVTATWGLLCPRCGARDLEEQPLSGRGRVVASTVQTVPAEGFVNDAPYAYVVVELEEGGRITGWIPGIRQPMEIPAGARVHWVSSPRAGVQFEVDYSPREEPPRSGGATPP